MEGDAVDSIVAPARAVRERAQNERRAMTVLSASLPSCSRRRLSLVGEFLAMGDVSACWNAVAPINDEVKRNAFMVSVACS